MSRVDTKLLLPIKLDANTRNVLLEILELSKRSPKAKVAIKDVEGALGRFRYLNQYADEGPRPSHIKAEIEKIRVHTQALCICMKNLTEAAANSLSSSGEYLARKDSLPNFSDKSPSKEEEAEREKIQGRVSKRHNAIAEIRGLSTKDENNRLSPVDKLRRKPPILLDLVEWCEEALEEQEPTENRHGKTKTARKDLIKKLSDIYDRVTRNSNNQLKLDFVKTALSPLVEEKILPKADIPKSVKQINLILKPHSNK